MTPAASRPADAGGGRARDAAVLLGALVAVALWLRWPAIAPSSLWLDDAWVAIVARADGPAQAAQVAFTHPLFTGLVWALTATFGVSSVVAQLPALVAGVGGVLAAWWVARRLGTSRAAALVAAALVAASPAHAVYSTRVKAYTLEVLAGFVLFWLAARVVARPDRARAWTAFVVGSLVATVTSASTAFLVAGCVVVLAVAQARRGWAEWRSLVAAVGAYALLAGPYWLLVSSTLSDALRGFWAGRYLPLDDPAVAWSRLVEGTRIVLEALLPGPAIVTLPVVLATAVGALLAARHRALVVGCLAVPVLVVAAAAAGAAPWGSGRTELLLLAPLALVAAIAVDELARRRPSLGLAVGVAAVVAVVGAALVAGRASYPREDVRELVARADGADAHVLVYPTTRWAFGVYTDAPVSLDADTDDPFGFTPRVDDPTVTVLPIGVDDPGVYGPAVREAVAGEQRVLLLVSHPAGDLPALRQAITGAGFTRADVARRDGARLITYERRT